jgi:ABC-2 type transport system ATP-binding protein
MSASPNGGDIAVEISHFSHRYPDGREAVSDLSLEVRRGEVLGLLGPNGSGKTTTFRVLSTLAAIQTGTIRVFGLDLASQAPAIRRLIGVVFQSPSLDKKLTVLENIHCHGHLYGMRGATLRDRAVEMLERFHLTDRANERVEKLSGGLARRAELAKGLLHRPALLLLDEPSSGLDPAARRTLWEAIEGLQRDEGVTAIVTTHIMEEAERCHRVALMDAGQLVAHDTPDALKSAIGGDVVTIRGRDAGALSASIKERFGHDVQAVEGSLRIEIERGHEFIPKLIEAFPGEIETVTLGKPTLEDVFIDRAGHRFETKEDAPAEGKGKGRGRKKTVH